MAITSEHVQVNFRYTWLGQKCQNVQVYRIVGSIASTISVTQLLEALWNDGKARLRAIAPASLALGQWDSLLGIEIGGSLSFGEYPIPTAERIGTRPVAGLTDALPSFTAMGFREVVGTRVTRPGQKRLPFLFEPDVNENVLTAGAQTLLEPVAQFFTSQVVLGAPAIGATLQPAIWRQETPELAEAFQDVEGYVINTDVTSQISRKKGRGS